MINGTYDAETNTIYLRADATYNAAEVRGILGHTLAHEVTHSIKVWSEADYNVLTDFIRDALGADFDALVKEKMDKLGMSYAMASDEAIADGCEMLLRDSKALEKLATENASLFVKVVTKVREFIANLRKAQTDMYDGNEELHDAALKLREALKSLEEVQEVFDNALENSIRNMRGALAEAENAKTRENLDVLEKQAEKEGLQLQSDQYLSISFSEEQNNETKYILQSIVDNIAKIPAKKVFTVNGVELQGRATDYVKAVFDEQGNVAHNSVLGDVELGASGAKSTMFHGYGANKLAAVRAIKPTIENGEIISKTENYQNTGVDRYIIAAMGNINGKESYVGVMIKSYPNAKRNSKFYLHEATIIETDPHIMTAVLKSSDTVSESVSKQSISDAEQNVNSKPQFSEEISDRDTEYLKLAKDPKKNAAQLRKLVDDAAKAAGFTKRLYHGTQGFDSTRINTGYSDDGISFFMSDDERVTSWYSGTDEKKPIGKNISENGANNYEFYTNTENMYEINNYGAQWDNILDADALDSEDAINKAFPESEGFTWDENDGFLNVYRDDVFYGEYVWDDESDRYVPNLPGRDPLPSRADGFGAGTTRSLSRAIYDSGKYSGVIFRKIHDAGFDNGNSYADIYNFFHPESQVKSADLVTYDDNGNIIPLSERFNTEKNELRFSEETADEFAENEKSAIEKALANMSVKDYNRRGWARTLLTREDASKLYSAVAKLFINKNRKEFRLKDGSYAVEVNNKIVFVSGTFENPRYESVLVFNTDNATEMEIIKDHFFGSAAITGLTQKDIERFIKQRRGYGQVYGFNAEDYKASGRRDFGRAMLRSNTKGFGDISQFEVRDGVYTKDEGNVSSRVQGLKFSAETDSDSSAKTAAKLKKEIEKATRLPHGSLVAFFI